MKKINKIFGLVFIAIFLIFLVSCNSKDNNGSNGSNNNGGDENKDKVENIYPSKYVLASDYDFEGFNDGQFVYIGNADYVIIPEYIKGVKVTKTNSLSESFFYDYAYHIFMKKPQIKGVAFERPENIVDMSLLFYDNVSTALELQHIKTTNVERMSGMFFGSQAVNLNLSHFDTSKVTSMGNMFHSSKASKLDLSSFNTSEVTNMSGMFRESQATSINLSSFNTKNVKYMDEMFYESKATKLNLSSFDTQNVEDMSWMFTRSDAYELDVSSFNTKNVKQMDHMFYDSYATSLDLSLFNTSNVENMAWMFSSSHATTLDLSHFDTSKVSDMSYMFYQSKAVTIDVSNFDTSKVYNMESMFRDSHVTSLDLSSFETGNVSTMEYMFYNSQTAFLDLSNFNTSNVKNTKSMFYGTLALKGYVNNKAEAERLNNMLPIFIVTEFKDTISLGKYPQTVVDDASLIKELDKLTATNSNGYYEYKGNEYAKVRTNMSVRYFNNGEEIKNYTTYYFKVEPIQWRILESKNGVLTLITDFVIELGAFNLDRKIKTIDGKTIYPNNYEHSSIRSFLNDDLYNKIFDGIEKDRILSTSINHNGNNISDKMFLLGSNDVLYNSFAESRVESQGLASDYSKARGFAYLSYWWLRSPATDNSQVEAAYYYNELIRNTDVVEYEAGIRPMIRITID